MGPVRPAQSPSTARTLSFKVGDRWGQGRPCLALWVPPTMPDWDPRLPWALPLRCGFSATMPSLYTLIGRVLKGVESATDACASLSEIFLL